MTGAAASARRAVWGVLDQALSSLINFVVGFLVARSVSDESFGAFSIALAVNIAFVVTGRALAGEPFLIRHSHRPPDEWRHAVAAASGISLTLGVLGGAALIGAGLLLGGLLGEALVPLGFVLPGLLLQDGMRFAYVAHGRPLGAFLADLSWFALLVPALLLVHDLPASSISLAVLAWGGTAFVAAAAALTVARAAPSPRAAAGWWRTHRDIAPRFAAEGLISLSASQLTILVVGVLVGLAGAGALRGAQLLLGPMQVLLMGTGIIAVPEGVAIRRRRGLAALSRAAVLVSAALSGTALAYAFVLELIPDQLGPFLLGETWPAASTILAPMSLAYAVLASGVGAGIGLRVLADARRSLRGRSVDAVSQAGAGIAGAAALGIRGAAMGLLVGAAFGSLVLWSQFRASLRQAHDTERLADGRRAAESAGVVPGGEAP